MKDDQFVLDYVNEVHYKCNEISLNRGGSYIESPLWLKDEKGTINPKMMMIIVFYTL